MATLGILGDVMLGRSVDEAMAGRDPAAAWGDVLPLLRAADAVFANLECALTRSRRPWRRSPKTFHFRAAPERVAILTAANVRYAGLANNHVLDFETEGLAETLAVLDAAGIARSGAGPDAAAARRPALVDVADLRVAVFSVTDNMPEAAAGPDRPGIWWVDPGDPRAGPSAREIEAARRAGADLVVLAAHLGPNMLTEPEPALAAFKRRMVERGVDLVWGHSAHLFQGVEPVAGAGRTGVILHDTGDGLDDYAVDPRLRNDWSFLVLAELARSGVRRLRLVPLRLGFAEVRLATPPDRDDMMDRMVGLSRALGTELRREADALTLDLAPGPGGAP